LGKLATLVLTAAAAFAQPPLTTIQDTLYKADGTLFNGILVISWNSFQADNQANIVSQSITVQVVGGLFQVQLVPTADATPPSFYTVVYNSDGKIQFQETWVVPVSTTPLTISAVRTSATTPYTGPVEPPSQSPIPESAVIGLSGDLSLRPVKGTGFSTGRVAMINSSGGIDGVIGNSSDCVFVDGTSGPCGTGGGAVYSDGEIPGGTVDGTNTTFTLANAPSPAASLELFRNGVAEKSTVDYTLTGSTVQFLTGAIPQPGDTLLAWYRLASGSGGTQATTPQIYCSAAGTSTSGTSFTSLGSCSFPSSTLQTGDRVEIHFDLAHTGSTSGFEYEVLWGATVVTDRVAATGDAVIAGKGEAAIYSAGSQLRAESWGTVLAFAASVGNATDNTSGALTINFQMKMAQTTTDTISLTNFTVVRYPAH
jgi:hypothetical protein